MRLNLGCGPRPLEGFVNIDADPNYGDCVADITHLPYEDGSIEEIFASHILEHFDWTEVDAVLDEWIRVLKPEGCITIVVPDCVQSAHMVAEGRMTPLEYGGLTHGHGNGTRERLSAYWKGEDTNGSHLSCWSARLLLKYLLAHGLTVERIHISPHREYVESDAMVKGWKC